MSHVDDGTLHALVDNELDASEREAVEAHLATCGECARRFAEATAMARQVVTLLGALDEGPARVRVVPSVGASTAETTVDITPLRRRVFTLRRVAIAASLLMVAGVSYEVGTRRESLTPQAATDSPASVALKAAPREASPRALTMPLPVVAVAEPVRDSATQRRDERMQTAQDAAQALGRVQAREAAGAAAPAPSPRATRMAQRPMALSAVVVTGASGAPAPPRAGAIVSADAVANGTAPKIVTLPGYVTTEEESVPATTRRRYVSSEGTALTLLIVQTPSDARKRAVAADSVPQFTVTALDGRSIVRWHARGMDYELQGALAPDSLVKLATQLK